MTREQLDNLKQWLTDYADGFIAREENPEAYILKKTHTFRVCREIVDLGRELGLGQAELLLGEAAACLHDAGRFRQMKQYGTFVDELSEDHARLGLQVIEEERLLDNFSKADADILRTAVAFHNAAEVPGDKDETTLFFIKLLRDADKLDIWRVVTSQYELNGATAPPFITLGLADDGQYSREALQAVAEKHLVHKSAVTRLNDFKLMQISWVFDINFVPAIKKVIQRGYIPTIMATLPDTEELSTVFKQVEAYMNGFSQ